ncbi:MAG: hypothetical protein L0221_11295, partial [Chloroflexi bacterium]|nr:hypothetical protein [Chloroflexota bacterium]
MITGTVPPARQEGERADVTITGFGFVPGAAVDFGPGVTVEEVTFVSPEELRCRVKIADTGAASDRPVGVKVTNPGAVFPNVSRAFTIQPSTNRPPEAVAAAPSPVECTSPSGATVALDGSGSTDADSSTATNDDIVSFEWFEDFGAPSETLLGTGAAIEVTLPLGPHAITLRVTDTHDATDLDTIQVVVEDTTPPAGTVSLAPHALWPPNHMMVDVHADVAASDLCGGVTVMLASVDSSEPDDAAGGGDGSTVMDVQGADPATADVDFALRAERQGQGTGRIYTATYAATDDSGNAASMVGIAAVPHADNGVTEPLVLALRETALGTIVEWAPVQGALVYNVIRGRVTNLRDVGPYFDVGPVVCIEAASADTSTEGRGDAELPAEGEAYFYLAEFDDGWNHSYGTEEAAKPRVPGAGACAASD